ncbi:Wadjet anti-phage system protein JetD domain-containing protein [Mycobacterium kansasii]
MATAICELAGQGHIAVPRTRYDHSSDPPLPSYVTRPPTPASKRAVPAAPVWHAEMSWAAGLDDSGMLTPADKSFLATVNGWLPRRRGVVIPMRERSLDIFGDEKLLETRINGPLFAPGRLTLPLLETYPCWPPVNQIVSGHGDWLIVENFTTYHSISIRANQIGFDGRLIWGSGKQVGTRLAALALAGESPPPCCYYFGDLDIAGFRIAKSAAIKASDIGLPALTPARGLYRLALRYGIASPPTTRGRVDASLLDWVRAWLGDELGVLVTALLGARRRIVQEYVGSELLASTVLSEWFD